MRYIKYNTPISPIELINKTKEFGNVPLFILIWKYTGKQIRGKNNTNWMDILRLSFKKSPKETARLMAKIYSDDQKISKLVKKLSK